MNPSSQGSSEVLNVVGSRIRVLVDFEASGGKYAIFEDSTQPGSGPPLHRHGVDDEHFYVVEGSVKFSLNGNESIHHAGDFVNAPRGSVHTYCNVGTGPLRMLVFCSPGGLEVPFRKVDRLSREGPLDIAAVEAAFAEFDLRFVGPPLKP
jgi:quercetin dioxygenase-like cupin family protein